MAYIKTLKDNELVNGTNNDDVYPVSTTQALFSQYVDPSDHQIHVRMKDNKPEKLEDRLQDHEADAALLHKQIEKLVPYLSGILSEAEGTEQEIVITSPVEINDKIHKWTLTGNAKIETPGDEPNVYVDPNNMSTKQLYVIFGSNSTSDIGHVSGNNYVGEYTIPNVVGRYTARFDCTYNNIPKSVTTSADVNLRKYFGFAAAAPSDVTALGTSHFSNTVGCTVTIPATNNGFQRIYFAVPAGMTITSIIQPDSFNAPLDFSQVGTVDRTIGGTTYSYKLYQSTDLIDSANSKRLTIS